MTVSVGERTTDGRVVRLRPRGASRFISGAFLAFWLCGWAIGEGLVLWILVKGGYALLTGTPPDPGRQPLEVAPALAMGAFLLFWLLLWTVGGIAAFAALLQLLWAEDRITARSYGVTHQWFRGPFRGTKEFARDRVRGFDVASRKRSLVLETDRERVILSELGTAEEREAASRSLRLEMGLAEPDASTVPLPKGWEEIITPEGERAVVPDRSVRRVQARVAAGAAIALSIVAFVVLRDAGQKPALIPMAVITTLATAALAWGAFSLAWGRMEYRIGSGSITVRRRFRSTVRELMEARRLEVIVQPDSDGGERFLLEALASEIDSHPARAFGRLSTKGRRSIASTLHDPAVIRNLGSWLSRVANIPLVDRTTPEAREAEITSAVEQLANQGPLGRVAARLIRTTRERRGY
ncbi:MAG TPA: hypothetical protein VGQ14_00670 [Candidatus Eisenbacteria bacterium]|nr:hypothetical protein [Candidatus Eisenbacteria bacterium]